MIAGTRVALGAGIGLLLAERAGAKRRGAGWALLAVGALTTIPIAVNLFRKKQTSFQQTMIA